jgi:uncharacterized protein YraI
MIARALRGFGAAALLALAALAAVPVRAESQYGTPAWALSDLTLRQGPGAAYHATGAIPDESRITVLRCAPRWCLVAMDHAQGWTSRDHVGFGQEPRPMLTGPRLNYGSGGPGRVCFYEGTHFTGAFVCHESGFVAHDLLLYGSDDRYASVTVEGSVSAAVCRDRNFQSYCTRVVESEPVLNGYLLRNVSSIRIY